MGQMDDVRLRRGEDGWVADGDAPEDRRALLGLLADALLDDHARPAAAPRGSDELSILRATVAQLQYALAGRVEIDRAVGVLAERRRVDAQAAFDLLRQTCRRRGEPVHRAAALVVASTVAPPAPVDELDGALSRL